MALSPEAKKMVHSDKYRKVDPALKCTHSDKYRKVDWAQKCTQIIEAALKEYGCSFQVVMVPQVTVITKPKA